MSSSRKFHEIPELVKHVFEYTNHAPSYLAAAQTSKLFYKCAKELSEETSSRGTNIRNILTKHTKIVSKDIHLEKEVRKNFVFFPKKVTNTDVPSFELRRIAKAVLVAALTDFFIQAFNGNSTFAISILFLVFIVMMNPKLSFNSEAIQQNVWNFFFNKYSHKLNENRLSTLNENIQQLAGLAITKNFLNKKF